MFTKDSKTSTKSKDRVPSIISASLRITGDLLSEGDVQVDGVIEGDVNVRSLTVSEGATVKGEITAEKVSVSGSVVGMVTAQSVALGRTAEVHGDIHHHELAVEPGAVLDGQCCRRQESPKPATEPVSAKADETKAGKAQGDEAKSGSFNAGGQGKPSIQAAE